VIARYLDLDPGPLPTLGAPERTRTPSAAAIAEAEALPPDLPPNERRARVAAIYARDLAEGGARYDPVPPDLRARLRETYAEDLARLRARLGDRLVAPPDPAPPTG
jgi:hypothetical protein